MRDTEAMRSLSDEELVRRSRNGDAEAETILMQRYKSVVRTRTASLYMEGGDPEDLMQEGMIGLFKAIRDYDDTKAASFHTFAELCIRRQAISAVKGASRLKHQPLNTSLSLNYPMSENDDSTLEETLSDRREAEPEKLLLLRESVEYLLENMEQKLSVKELNAWRLFVQGCSNSEIAAQMDCGEKDADNALRRAKKKLTEMMVL